MAGSKQGKGPDDPYEVGQFPPLDTDNGVRDDDGPQEIGGVPIDEVPLATLIELAEIDDEGDKVTAAQIVAFFATLVGIAESPKGSNRCSITAWFGWVAAWCAMTVSYVFAHFGRLDLLGLTGKGTAATVTLYERFKALGIWHGNPSEKLQPGDVGLFNFGDPTWGGRPLGIHHTGVCVVDLGDGRAVFYEGNTDDAVRRRIRSKGNLAGFGRPRYDSAPATVTPPKPKPKPPATHRLLKVRSPKMRGDDVKFVQRYLIARGYSCGSWGADGVYGNATAAAVRAYQTKRLPRYLNGEGQWDGIVGPHTWALIDAGK